MGLLMSFVYSRICLGRESGSEPRLAVTVDGWLHHGMIVLPIDDQEAFHCHHWMLLLPLTFLPLTPSVHWFIVGMVIQGLSYSDRFSCFASNPYTEQEDEELFVDDWV